MLVGLTSALPEIADLSHDASAERDQIAGRAPILAPRGISCSWPLGFRRDNERLGGGNSAVGELVFHVFGAIAHFASGELDA
jgi:hypothetical protein